MEITFSELIEHLESFPVKNNFQFIHFQCDGKVIVEWMTQTFQFNIITVGRTEIYFILTICWIYGVHRNDVQTKVNFCLYISIVILEGKLNENHFYCFMQMCDLWSLMKLRTKIWAVTSRNIISLRMLIIIWHNHPNFKNYIK